MPALTPEQIARLRADGKTLRQIATELGVSITTICRWKDPAYRERHNASQRRSRLRNRERIEERRRRWLERTAPRCSRCGRPLTRPTASRQPVVCGACSSEAVAERLLDVLQDLNRERPIEARGGHRERGRVRLVVLNVVVPFGALRSPGEHVRADFHTRDQAVPPDYLEQLGDVEAGPQPASSTRSPARAPSAARTSSRWRSTSRVA
jgi:Homeodomain-like domain